MLIRNAIQYRMYIIIASAVSALDEARKAYPQFPWESNPRLQTCETQALSEEVAMNSLVIQPKATTVNQQSWLSTTRHCVWRLQLESCLLLSVSYGG